MSADEVRGVDAVRQKPEMSPVPEVKAVRDRGPGWLRTVAHFMRKRWKGFIGGTFLIASAACTGGLSIGLQAIGGTLLFGEAGHEIGRQTTRYNVKGDFTKTDLFDALRDLLQALIKLLKIVANRPQK